MDLSLGVLEAVPALSRPDLLAEPVAKSLTALDAALSGAIGVAEIDPALADTAAFCERYQVGLDVSANCVVITGKREGQARYAACVVLATTRADVNNVARRELDVRKASFAGMADAVEQTSMEYGGITPVGLPAGWPVLVDARAAALPKTVIGSGVRRSKLVLPGPVLAALPGVTVIDGLAR